MSRDSEAPREDGGWQQVGERRWQCWARRENKKRRVGRTRTFCASHKRQEVNAQKGPASERTRDKNVTMSVRSHGCQENTRAVDQATLSEM